MKLYEQIPHDPSFSESLGKQHLRRREYLDEIHTAVVSKSPFAEKALAGTREEFESIMRKEYEGFSITDSLQQTDVLNERFAQKTGIPKAIRQAGKFTNIPVVPELSRLTWLAIILDTGAAPRLQQEYADYHNELTRILMVRSRMITAEDGNSARPYSFGQTKEDFHCFHAKVTQIAKEVGLTEFGMVLLIEDLVTQGWIVLPKNENVQVVLSMLMLHS